MLRTQRLIAPFVLGLILAACGAGGHASPASASTSMESIIQDDGQLEVNPVGTLDTFRLLGADRVRLSATWYRIAPSAFSKKMPRGFNPSNPASYPAHNWASFDAVDRQAAADGINLDITLTGPAPRWATGKGAQPPRGPHLQWKPNAHQFRLFVEAIGKRYSGTYVPPGQSTPLPRISFWAIWNEPNFGPDLAPQALGGRGSVESSPMLYRNLADSAWLGLHHTGHGSDTIIFGELAPRGYGNPPVFPGNFAGMKPYVFLHALYCTDQNNHRLRGSAATIRGCPAGGSSSAFRRQHPVLFNSSAFAIHPYPQGAAPNVGTGSEFADLANIHKLERTLDSLQRAWGSGRKYAIYNTEYGYQTRPPDKRFRQPSPTTAALYENWAEFISYRDSRIRSYTHYLLRDAPGGFPSGLEFKNGRAKATFDAWRMPLYLPKTKARKGSSLEVWGCVRPVDYNVGLGGATSVQIQFNGTTVAAVPVNPQTGYFDTHLRFPGSGSVRLAWAYPSGQTVYSRTQSIKLT